MVGQKTISEPARTTAVVGEYDVLVMGGGIAGVAAAIAAARNGARVCLVERYCGLGGLATLGNVTVWLPLCDGMGNQVIGGLGQELLELSVADLAQDNGPAGFRHIPACWQDDGDTTAREQHRYTANFNPASYMLALEKLILDTGIDLFYDSRFCGVLRDDQRITHVIIENKDGRGVLSGKTVIDATGDADVCHAAGEETVSFDLNVPCGWYYTFGHREALRLHHYTNPFWPFVSREEAQGPFLRGDSARHVTQHIVQSRATIRQQLNSLRSERPEEDFQLLMPPALACFRLTRRLVGCTTIQDFHVHRWCDDVVGLTGDWRQPGPVFAIPLDSLRAVKTSNLLAVGRCISTDDLASEVTRVIPPCVVTGQAAGVAAALACHQTNGQTDRITYAELKTRLQDQGVLLDRDLLAEERAGTG